MSENAEMKTETTKEKKIETIKSLARDLREQLANLSDRIYSVKARTIGYAPLGTGGIEEEKDVEDNSLAIIERILRDALDYGSNCHKHVTDLDEEL